MGHFTVGVAGWEVHGVIVETVMSLNLAGLINMGLSELLQMLRSAWNIHVHILPHAVVS